jgi:uroporphyrinogen decarboxylase
MTVATSNDLILRAARGERTERTPVWLMRQAGRFDPAYRELRERSGLPLEAMFRTPDLAAEITLLPQRFGVDALILFQDILTPVGPMGAEFLFRPGPVLERPVRTRTDVDRLRDFECADQLAHVVEEIGFVREATGDDPPLLGFAGAPLTVAAFMVEGQSPCTGLRATRVLMQRDPETMHRLLDRLSDVTAAYLRLQIDAGVAGVQLFESVADLLTESEYRAFALPYQRRILEAIGEAVPRILFVKERSWLDLMLETGADVLSVGACVDLTEAREIVADHIALQGNVDNQLVAAGTSEQVELATRACIRAGGHHGHILNLNHGLLRNTPVENVVRLIETCRNERIEA